MSAIDLNTVIVPGPVITPVSGVWRWQPAVTATNYHKIYERERAGGGLGTCHSQNIKIEIVNRSVIAICEESVYDEGDIVIISWARINQSLGDEPCNLSSIALQIFNVLKYLHWSNFQNKISIDQKYVQTSLQLIWEHWCVPQKDKVFNVKKWLVLTNKNHWLACLFFGSERSPRCQNLKKAL